VGLLANKDPAARKYAEWTGKACRADGLRYELRTLEDPIQVEAALIDANDDPRVHGIIVYYPIFGQEESFSGACQDDYLRDTVSHKCDVEGLCHSYRTNLYRNVRYLDHPVNNQGVSRDLRHDKTCRSEIRRQNCNCHQSKRNCGKAAGSHAGK
jgi:5,10-methylene-tetrahydrofolate dehydrogenase/methenyl tetrahydrofolate cyclohydrolase